MSHQLYHTDGIVIASKNIGEANKVYYLLTKELGLILASAQGVRFAKSKLKAHLQVGKVIKLTLVHGRQVWRITGAEVSEDLTVLFRLKDGRQLVRETFALIRKLIHGEDADSAIFQTVVGGFKLAIELGQSSLSLVGLLISLRLLHHLGYLKSTLITEPLIGPEWAGSLIKDVEINRQAIEGLIENALISTHL